MGKTDGAVSATVNRLSLPQFPILNGGVAVTSRFA